MEEVVPGLSDEERQVLSVEDSWWRSRIKKSDALQATGMSSTHYYLVLNRALAKPAAELENPELVRRLKRLREKRGNERHNARVIRERGGNASGQNTVS